MEILEPNTLNPLPARSGLDSRRPLSPATSRQTARYAAISADMEVRRLLAQVEPPTRLDRFAAVGVVATLMAGAAWAIWATMGVAK